MIRLSLLALIILGAATFTGCKSPIAFTDQELRFRFNPEDDSLDLLTVYAGVTATKNDEETLSKALDGHLLPILAGMRELDLPLLGHRNLEALKGDPDTDLRTLRAIENFQLEDVSVFLDAEGRLAGSQRFRMTQVSAALVDWNHRYSESVLEKTVEGTLSEELSGLDPRSLELWAAQARRGRPWVRLVEGGLELDLPLTRACATDLLEELNEEATKNKESFLAQALACLSSLQLEEERTLARFEGSQPGFYAFSFPADERRKKNYSPKLLEAFLARGYQVERHPDIPTLLSAFAEEQKE